MKLVIIGITVVTYFSLIRANLTFGQVNIGGSFLCLTVSRESILGVGFEPLGYTWGVQCICRYVL